MKYALLFATLIAPHSGWAACRAGQMTTLKAPMTIGALTLPEGADVHVTSVKPDGVEIYAMKMNGAEYQSGIITVHKGDKPGLACQVTVE